MKFVLRFSPPRYFLLLQAMVGQEEVVHIDGALVCSPPILANHQVSGGASPVSAVELSLYHLRRKHVFLAAKTR